MAGWVMCITIPKVSDRTTLYDFPENVLRERKKERGEERDFEKLMANTVRLSDGNYFYK